MANEMKNFEIENKAPYGGILIGGFIALLMLTMLLLVGIF